MYLIFTNVVAKPQKSGYEYKARYRVRTCGTSEKFRLFQILATILNFGVNVKCHLENSNDFWPNVRPTLKNHDYSYFNICE